MSLAARQPGPDSRLCSLQLIPDSLAESQGPPKRPRLDSGAPAFQRTPFSRQLSLENAPEPSAVPRALELALPSALQGAVHKLLPTLLQSQPELQELLAETAGIKSLRQDVLAVSASSKDSLDSLTVRIVCIRAQQALTLGQS